MRDAVDICILFWAEVYLSCMGVQFIRMQDGDPNASNWWNSGHCSKGMHGITLWSTEYWGTTQSSWLLCTNVLTEWHGEDWYLRKWTNIKVEEFCDWDLQYFSFLPAILKMLYIIIIIIIIIPSLFSCNYLHISQSCHGGCLFPLYVYNISSYSILYTYLLL